MLIKLLYDIPMENKDVHRFGDSLFDGVTERHTTLTSTPDGKNVVELTFRDMDKNTRSFYVTGTAYVMSDSGKTIDTIHGGDLPDGASYSNEGEILRENGDVEPTASDMIED